ncbi:glycoside hydrolase domain-containing protein [Nocardia vinacea]|uniref:glycoside hydrolase domain-containing protein n=1 Tax=Nocardia vinacea TaxID=96468 RepID=UPI0002D9AF8B|nr:glycoside hydrolase domain-containing protein [Nocardia vinacea]
MTRYWPLARGRIVTSRFGPRDDGFHWGVDLGWPGGSGGLPVYAVQAGTVVFAGPASGFGGPDPAGWVVLDHPAEDGGGTTVYGHVIREVAVGDRVEAGQRIARINPDSASNGGVAPHLHLEWHRHVWVPPGSDRLDPLPLLAEATDPPLSTNGVPRMSTAVDFAARFLDPDAIKAAGHSAVLVYVSPSRPGSSFGAKPVTREYADSVQAAGLDIVSIWQYGKPGNAQAPSDWTTGYDGGHRMGLQAREIHTAVGGHDRCPIFFAVDEDISLDQWNDEAVNFFRGVNDAIGREWTGVYGSSKVCAWAIQDGVLGRTSEGRFWAWQTRAWSGNRLDTPEAVLYQRVIDTASNPGPVIDGSSVDVNDILATDFGQWSIQRTQAQGEHAVNAPVFTELDRMGNSRSERWGARITNFLLHTQEGGGTAESLAAYLNNTANGASYHYTLRNGIVCDVVDTDYASWSVLDANAQTINLCFAGSRAAWSRDEWMAIDEDLRIAAWLAVQDAKKYGFATDVIAPPYTRRDGISDHKYVTECLGIGTHTDVGPNFPWDVFESHVREFSGAALAGEIDAKAAASPWLGPRLGTNGEIKTADGVGRFAQFKNGYIYWHPSTGAHPIPSSLFDKFAETGWEAGPLGYPITDNTVLRDPKDVEWGEVEGFQNGALYHRNGRPVYWIHGEIRDRWNRSGFENGPLGWPTSDEIPFDTGSYQEFENGRIYWTPKQTLALRSVNGNEEPLPDGP